MATIGPVTAQYIPLYQRIGELDPAERERPTCSSRTSSALRRLRPGRARGRHCHLARSDPRPGPHALKRAGGGTLPGLTAATGRGGGVAAWAPLRGHRRARWTGVRSGSIRLAGTWSGGVADLGCGSLRRRPGSAPAGRAHRRRRPDAGDARGRARAAARTTGWSKPTCAQRAAGRRLRPRGVQPGGRTPGGPGPLYAEALGCSAPAAGSSSSGSPLLLMAVGMPTHFDTRGGPVAIETSPICPPARGGRRRCGRRPASSTRAWSTTNSCGGSPAGSLSGLPFSDAWVWSAPERGAPDPLGTPGPTPPTMVGKAMAPVVHFRAAVALAGRFPALAGVDLSLDQGEVVVVVGANGAGKTSLLRACAGLLPVRRARPPSSGST